MTSPTTTTTTTTTRKVDRQRQVPSYGGNTFGGRVFMLDGHQLATATRQADGTIIVHHLRQAPLRRLRFAVAHRPLLRGLLLLPAQMGDLAALVAITEVTTAATGNQPPSQPPAADTNQPGEHPSTRTISPRALTGIAWTNAAQVLLRGLAGSLLILLGAATAGRSTPGLASLLAAAVFVLRPLLGARLAARSYLGQAALLHGAEHQALNCQRAGLPLTDANLAQSPTASVQCDTSLRVIDQAVFTVAAVALELWLPGWPLPTQLLAGSVVWVLARAVASELAMREGDRRVSGRRSLLGGLASIGLRRQTRHTARPGGPEHREVAARALAPLLGADQQAQLGPFPSPLRTISIPPSAPEGGA